MASRNVLVVACLLGACSGEPPSFSVVARIQCASTPDCSARGGTCIQNECRADNECAADADCAAGETCTPDVDFGGLCIAPGQPVMAGPAWSCAVGKDCPAGQGCGSDGSCHVDGECHNTWGADGYLYGDCTGADEICATSDDIYNGFCTRGRGGPDPYCRSTGTGECRYECTTADDCGAGDACTNGFCYGSDECTTTADCSPNHVCGVPENWDDYGVQWCLADENATCVPDGQGVCRWACETNLDCMNGGGCAADGFCHASNECTTVADCAAGELCHPHQNFGGLCGPPGH